MYGLPRGIQLKNPGNIRISDIPWEGKITPSSDTDFEEFSDVSFGIRAAAKIFSNYSKLDGLSTIAQYINRWAPPSDNNPTNSYAEFIANHCGVDSNNIFDLTSSTNLAKLLFYVFEFEQGSDFVTQEQITSEVDQVLTA